MSSLQISAIAEELARKTEDAARQQEEITHLLSQIVDLQKKAKSVSFFSSIIQDSFSDTDVASDIAASLVPIRDIPINIFGPIQSLQIQVLFRFEKKWYHRILTCCPAELSPNL